MPVNEVHVPYDKYASLRSDKPIKSDKDMTWNELLYAAAFGESEPTEFESLVSEWSAKSRQPSHRLRASASSKKLATVDGTMWTG